MLLPNECERGHAVLVEHIYVAFFSLHILEKIVFDLVLEWINILHFLETAWCEHPKMMKTEHFSTLLERDWLILKV